MRFDDLIFQYLNQISDLCDTFCSGESASAVIKKFAEDAQSRVLFVKYIMVSLALNAVSLSSLIDGIGMRKSL